MKQLLSKLFKPTLKVQEEPKTNFLPLYIVQFNENSAFNRYLRRNVR